MIDKELVKRYIVEFHNRDFSNIKKRELNINIIPNKAITIIGPRRSGKTYYLFSLIDNPEKYLYIDFENPIFYKTEPEDIIYVLDSYYELYPEIKNPIIFLDEVQVIKDWERIVRYLLDKNLITFATGSSSKLLSKEIATHLRGRSITYYIYPLSFREFLNFKDISFTGKDLYLNINKIKSLLYEYLKFGAYPEVVLNNEKEKILKDYLDLIVKKDILERYKIRNIYLMNELIYFVINNYSRYISYDSLFKLFKEKIGLTKITIVNYIKYLEESLFVFLLRKYSHSIKDRVVSPRKVYLIDIGFSLFGKKNISSDMENIVYLELLRKTNYNPLMEIYYFKDYQQHEVDFVIKEGSIIKQLIQVSYVNSRDELDRREYRSLIKASNLLNCNDLLIISWDYEDNLKIDNKEIKVIPLWKWLLNIQI